MGGNYLSIVGKNRCICWLNPKAYNGSILFLNLQNSFVIPCLIHTTSSISLPKAYQGFTSNLATFSLRFTFPACCRYFFTVYPPKDFRHRSLFLLLCNRNFVIDLNFVNQCKLHFLVVNNVQALAFFARFLLLILLSKQLKPFGFLPYQFASMYLA